MKKYVASFLAGAVFVLSASAFADNFSLIGKKIQGQTVVKIEGQELDTAIIVDGKSYSPTRSIGEAAGFDVSMKDKEIILNKKTSQTATASGKGQSVEEQTAKLNERITLANKRIEETELLLKGMIEETKKPGYVDKGEQVFIDNYNKTLTEQQTLLADLESELAALK